MRRRLASTLTALVVAALLAGCTGGGPSGALSTGPSASATGPTASPTPTRSPFPTTPPTDPAVVFAADGIGGYNIGADLTDLQTRGMVSDIVPVPLCVDTKQAEATGVYAGKLTLTFRAAQLSDIHTTDPAYLTPSGAKVGLPVADLTSTYGPRAAVITGRTGQAITVRVPATTLALVFALDPTNTTVAGMFAGQAAQAEDAATTGQAC
jgi:hypothetical protein